MIIISHRGNTDGESEFTANVPDAVSALLNKGIHCEIDVWKVFDKYFLGHNEPKYEVEKEFLKNEKLWCHAKNLVALEDMLHNGVHCFWHEEDECVLTSKGIMWVHPKVIPPDNSIAVLPEVSTPSNYWAKKRQIKRCYGVCSDYIENYL